MSALLQLFKSVPIDKYEHFIIGFAITFGIAAVLEHFMQPHEALYTGVVMSAMHIIIKIFLFDIPKAARELRKFDWVEKGWDCLAQFLGTVAGAALFIYT